MVIIIIMIIIKECPAGLKPRSVVPVCEMPSLGCETGGGTTSSKSSYLFDPLSSVKLGEQRRTAEWRLSKDDAYDRISANSFDVEPTFEACSFR